MKRTHIPKNAQQTLFRESLEPETFVMEENAKLNFILFGTKGNVEKTKLLFQFSGSNSEVKFLGLFWGKEKNAFLLETVSRHTVPQTKAQFTVISALDDTARIDYAGTILIEKKAQQTESYLTHHTLLLSHEARAKTLPALEIKADDVKAGHAATIGSRDEESLFYLQSRGIDEKKAEQIMIMAFFEKEIQKVQDKNIQKKIRNKLKKELPET